MYDAAKAGLRCAYLGSEVTQPEFNARANVLAQLRGDKPNSWALRRVLAQVRYLNLAPIIGQAWEDPATWVEGIAERYDLVAIDPLSVVGSTLDLDFDRSNREFVQFYDRLVAPLTARNVAVVLVENIGHASDARNRPKGASAKSDTADLTFVCRGKANPPGMEIECRKVRTVRAAFEYGHKWRFMKDTQAFGDVAAASESVVVITLAKLREVYDFIAGNPDCSKSAIYMGVQGRQETISEHIERLVHEGKVARKPKPGRGVVKAGHVYRVAQPWD